MLVATQNTSEMAVPLLLGGFVSSRASQVEQGGFVMLKGLICNHCADAKQGLKEVHAKERKLPVGVHTHF